MARVLLLYDSRGGLTEQLAAAVADGVREAGGELVERRVDDAEVADLLECDALIIGSPNWSGVTGRLKEWFDYSGDRWQSGELAGKVGAAFAAGYSRSGGIEATLLQLLHLLFAHGMVVIGLPWTDAMRESGSYYGATAHGSVTAADRAQARELGHRLTRLALELERGRATQPAGDSAAGS